jgi:hypothetical protein
MVRRRRWNGGGIGKAAISPAAAAAGGIARCHGRRIGIRPLSRHGATPASLRHRNLRAMLAVDDRMVGSIAVQPDA